MTDEVRDLDDVEAQAWAAIYAAWSTFAHESAEGHADNGVRLLRERRAHASRTHTGTSSWDTSAHGRSAERAAVVSWLRKCGTWVGPRAQEHCASLADAIERGEHVRERR